MIWPHLNNYSFIDDESIFRENIHASMPNNINILTSTMWYKNTYRRFQNIEMHRCPIPMIHISVRYTEPNDHTLICVNFNIDSNVPDSLELINMFKHALCLMYSQNSAAFESFLHIYSEIEDEEYKLNEIMKQFYEDIIEFVYNHQCYVLK
jgi:hypothetical protein